MSQAINRDPEVRELKREFGLPGFSMWLEVLAETDGSEGIWRGSEIDIGRVLAGVCNSNTRGSARLLQWVTERGWITWLTGAEAGQRRDLKVVNHAKYHPSRDANKLPTPDAKGSSLASLPSYPSFPSINNNPPVVPQCTADGFDEFWIGYPKKVGKGAARKAWRSLKPTLELRRTILAAIDRHKKSEQWNKERGRFIPNPATWLNQGRWEDEVADFLGSTRRKEMPD